MDDLWRSRLRADAYPAPGPGHSRSGVPAFLGKVTSTGSNLGVGKFCQVLPVALTGTESDGSASTATAGPASVIALAIGPTAPATNDFVVVRRVDHRWVFDKQTVGGSSGGGPVTQANCPCTGTPASLTLTCTYGPGKGIHDYDGNYVSQSLDFFATPPSYATFPFGAGTNRYYSPTFMNDFGETVFYMIFCTGSTNYILEGGGYSGGTPVQSFTFFRWSAAVCSPFLLSTGTNSGTGGTDYPAPFSADGGTMVAS